MFGTSSVKSSCPRLLNSGLCLLRCRTKTVTVFTGVWRHYRPPLLSSKKKRTEFSVSTDHWDHGLVVQFTLTLLDSRSHRWLKRSFPVCWNTVVTPTPCGGRDPRLPPTPSFHLREWDWWHRYHPKTKFSNIQFLQSKLTGVCPILSLSRLLTLETPLMSLPCKFLF